MLQQGTLLVHLINSKFNITTNPWGVGLPQRRLESPALSLSICGNPLAFKRASKGCRIIRLQALIPSIPVHNHSKGCTKDRKGAVLNDLSILGHPVQGQTCLRNTVATSRNGTFLTASDWTDRMQESTKPYHEPKRILAVSGWHGHVD